MDKEEHLDNIINQIFSIDVPKIDESRKDKVRGFIKTTINGDTTQLSLVISASLGKDKRGILVYVLTDARLIKITIEEAQEMQSSSLKLDTIIDVQYKLIEADNAAVEVISKSGSMGLRYSAKKQNILDFFQEVDKRRIKGSSNG